jgi:hypothetical protein
MEKKDDLANNKTHDIFIKGHDLYTINYTAQSLTFKKPLHTIVHAQF